DLGAESGRVMAGLFDGGRIRLEEQHRFPNRPVWMAGTLRWNVMSLWSEIQTGLAKSASALGDRVTSVGVDTWGVDYVLLSKKREFLGQPWHYRDGRTQGLLNKALSRVPQAEIFRQTGLQFMEINTLYQLLAMQEHDPELLGQADLFLMMPDFFHWCLSGSQVVEFTNATTSQCFHATERNWAWDLLRQLQLPPQIFPEVVLPGTKLGKLREGVAQRTGLPRIEVVTPATHDTGAAVAAIPTQNTGQPNWAYISSGTWSLMGVETAQAVLTDQAMTYNVTNEGGVDGTYRLLKNIMGLWLIQECKRSWERAGQTVDYGQLTQWASEAEPFRSLVNPDDNAFLSPADMPQAIQDWCRSHGEPVPETPGQIVRCALESLALKYNTVLGWLEELTGTAVEVIHIVGGGTQNQLLNQFTANACGRPVITGPVEATVLGNVLIQARSAGEIGSLSEIRDVVRNSFELTTYEPESSPEWQQANSRFQN
ncbi:MAG: rhamnulokinase, partial [Planctomycetaceae bacterium]|nr:rhamnulokinase [Planctomycetaceae bacterium]